MTDRIKWIQPSEITERELQEKTLPEVQKVFRLCTRYFLMAGIPLVILGYFVNGLNFSVFIFFGLAWLIYQYPVIGWVSSRQIRKCGIKCQVNSKGIQYSLRFFYWREVQEYNLRPSDLSSDVVTLNLKMRPNNYWRSLSYYRHDVDEQELRSVLERFAPQSEQPAV